MTHTPRRAWFQIHLSTALALCFLAGGIVWLNCTARSEQRPPHRSISVAYTCYGWPFSIVEYRMDLRTRPGASSGSEAEIYFEPQRQPIQVTGLILDFALAASILLSVGYRLERRSRQQVTPPDLSVCSKS